MKILAFDLETSPMLSWHWGRWQQNIRPEQTVQESRVLCFGARFVGEKKFHFRAAYEDGRDVMLQEIHDLLSEADAVMSWNGRSFDSKKIRTEFLRERMGPPPAWRELDLMVAVKRQFAFSSNKLDAVAKELGVGEKVKHEGFGLWLKVMEGDPAARRKFRAYQRGDVDLLCDLHEVLLPWIPNYPNVAIHDDRPDGCPQCGGLALEKRGFDHTNAGRYQRYKCLNRACGKWSRGVKRIATSELRAS